MKSVVVSLALGLAAGAATLAMAQTGPRGGSPGPGAGPARDERFTPQDREAFTDARVAGMRAGLKLTPEQENLWPPVEEALRGLAKQREEARAARRERWASFRDGNRSPADRNVPDDIRSTADQMGAASVALRRLADASAPLWATLDEGQKRRLRVLSAMGREGMGPGEGRWGGPMRRGARDDRGRGGADGGPQTPEGRDRR